MKYIFQPFCLERLWAKKCGALGKLIRYADDFVVMSPTESKAKEALRQIQFVTNKLGLVLHPEKTRMVDLRRGKGSFVFLGCTIRKKRSILRNPRAYYMHRWPSPKATKRLRDRTMDRGVVRAFHAKTGQPKWSWDPTPAGKTGAANTWAPMSMDAKHDLLLIPTGSASPDFFGGRRSSASWVCIKVRDL